LDVVGASAPQLAHFLVAFIDFPHSGQNFVPSGTSALQFGQGTVTAPSLAPQLRQNLFVCGFWVLHFGHMIIATPAAAAVAGAVP
jgi:hypothetical protein